MQEIEKDEKLNDEQKSSAKRMRQAALDSCRRDLERITRSHTNINWNFNSLIEIIVANLARSSFLLCLLTLSLELIVHPLPDLHIQQLAHQSRFIAYQGKQKDDDDRHIIEEAR